MAYRRFTTLKASTPTLGLGRPMEKREKKGKKNKMYIKRERERKIKKKEIRDS